MNLARRAALLVVLLAILIATEICQAGSPPYVVLQPRRAEGAAQSTPAQRYSYGWFGVAPRKHAVRHFGYYKNYTQWSFR